MHATSASANPPPERNNGVFGTLPRRRVLRCKCQGGNGEALHGSRLSLSPQVSDVAKSGAVLAFLYSEKGKELLGVVGKGRHISVDGMVVDNRHDDDDDGHARVETLFGSKKLEK